MVLFFWGYESLSKGYNVLNEFMFQSHMRFCRMQWLPTRFYGSLSVYSRPLPSEKIAPWQPREKSPFGDSCFFHDHKLSELSATRIETTSLAVSISSGKTHF